MLYDRTIQLNSIRETNSSSSSPSSKDTSFYILFVKFPSPALNVSLSFIGTRMQISYIYTFWGFGSYFLNNRVANIAPIRGFLRLYQSYHMFSWLLWIASRNPLITNLYWVLSPGSLPCVQCFPHIYSFNLCNNLVRVGILWFLLHDLKSWGSEAWNNLSSESVLGLSNTTSHAYTVFVCICAHSTYVENHQWREQATLC